VGGVAALPVVVGETVAEEPVWFFCNH